MEKKKWKGKMGEYLGWREGTLWTGRSWKRVTSTGSRIHGKTGTLRFFSSPILLCFPSHSQNPLASAQAAAARRV